MSSKAKTVAILTLGYRHYAVAPTNAAKLVELLSKLEPVRHIYNGEGPCTGCRRRKAGATR